MELIHTLGSLAVAGAMFAVLPAGAAMAGDAGDTGRHVHLGGRQPRHQRGAERCLDRRRARRHVKPANSSPDLGRSRCTR